MLAPLLAVLTAAAFDTYRDAEHSWCFVYSEYVLQTDVSNSHSMAANNNNYNESKDFVQINFQVKSTLFRRLKGKWFQSLLCYELLFFINCMFCYYSMVTRNNFFSRLLM